MSSDLGCGQTSAVGMIVPPARRPRQSVRPESSAGCRITRFLSRIQTGTTAVTSIGRSTPAMYRSRAQPRISVQRDSITGRQCESGSGQRSAVVGAAVELQRRHAGNQQILGNPSRAIECDTFAENLLDRAFDRAIERRSVADEGRGLIGSYRRRRGAKGGAHPDPKHRPQPSPVP